MTSGGLSGCRYIALLIAMVDMLHGGPSHGADLDLNAATASQVDDFRGKLHDFAVAKAGVKLPGYFAIVRRGLDQQDDLSSSVGSGSALAGVDLAKLSGSPEAVDLDPRGQVLTSLRLGIRPDNKARITDGKLLDPGEYDEAVMLTGNGFLCSGVAVDRSTVLTAAHCACDLHLAQSDGPFRDDQKVVVAGQSNAVDAKSSKIDLEATRFISKDVFGVLPCPDVLPGLQAGRPDLALVRLKAGSFIDAPPLKIATSELLEKSIGKSFFFVIGFGCTKPIQPSGHFLRCDSGSTGAKFGALINTSAQCSNPGAPDGCAPGAKEFSLRDSNFKKDTCAGDSGGPVILFENNSFSLAGITSRALNPNGTCGLGGIYEKVSTQEVVEWLKKSVNVVQ